MNKKIIFLEYFFLLLLLTANLSISQNTDESLIQGYISPYSSGKEKVNYLINLVNYKLSKLELDTKIYLDHIQLLIENDKLFEYQGDLMILYAEYWDLMNEYQLSIEYNLKALKFFETKNNLSKVGYVYKSLGETYRASGNLTKSLEMLYKAEKIFKSNKEDINLSSTYNRIAAVLFETYPTTAPNEFTTILKKTLDHAFKSNELAGTKNLGLNISNFNIIGAAYRECEDFDNSLKYLQEAIDLMKLNPDSNFSYYNMPNVMGNMALTLRKLKRFGEAIEVSKVCLEYMKEKNITYYLGYIYSIMALTYEDMKDYENAYNYIQKNSAELIKTFNNRKSRMILELQTKYETEKKEKEIEKNQITQKYQIVIFMGSLLILIIPAIVFYTRQRSFKRLNHQISVQNKALSSLNSTKDKFFSIIAHDLKNPAYSIKGLLEVLVRDEQLSKNDNLKNELQAIYLSSVNLTDLLDNLLTWSQSQRGIIRFNPVTLTAKDVITNNLELLKNQADKKYIILKNKCISDIVFTADVNMINAVFRNLISNGIKFTNKNGSVSVDATIGNGVIKFSVSDTGVGMDTETTGNLFDLDKNISNPGTEDERGTGLGLILCKEFVEKHSGNIWAESQPGKGSTFYFTIPVQ